MKIARTFLLATAFCASQFAMAQETFKIGAIYALTGPVAPYGTAQQKALQLRTEQLNARGGFNGRKVEVVYYDTEGNGNKTVQFVRKAIESDKVDLLIGPSTTGESLLAGPIANEFKVPMITHSGSQSVVSPTTPYVFQTAQYDRVSVPVVLKELKEKGFRKVALLSSTDGFGQSGAAVLKELAPQFGITFVAEEFDRQDTDMTAQVLRAKQGGVDAMLIWSTFPAPAIILRNVKAQGFTKPVYNSYAMATQEFLKQAGAAANGTYVMAAAILLPAMLPDSHPSKAILMKDHQDFMARFKEPPNPSSQHALDAMDIVDAAVKKISGAITRQSLRDAIEKTELHGANGFFKFSPTSHGVSDIDPPIVFLKVVNSAYAQQ